MTTARPLIRSTLRILFIVIMGLWTLGQLGRFELSDGRALYMHDVALALFVGLTVIFNWKVILRFLVITPDTQRVLGKKHSQEVIKKEKKDKPLLQLPSVLTWQSKDPLRKQNILRFLSFFFVAFNVLVVLNSLFFFASNRVHLLTGLLYLVRFDMIVAFGVCLFLLIKERILTSREVSQALSAGLVWTTALGFVQYLIWPDTRELVLLGWDDHYYRMIGTLFDPGFLGIILAIAALMQIHALVQRASEPTSKQANGLFPQIPRYLATYGLFLLFTVALLLTYSRASYVAFTIGVILIAIKGRSVRTVFLIPLFVLSLFLLPRPGGEGVNLARTASIQARIESNQTATSGLRMASLLIGQGWYNVKAEQPATIRNGQLIPNHSSAPENSFVFVVSSLGIVGLVVWGSILGGVIKAVGISSIEAIVLMATSIHALFSNTLFHPFVLILFAVIMARKLASTL